MLTLRNISLSNYLIGRGIKHCILGPAKFGNNAGFNLYDHIFPNNILNGFSYLGTMYRYHFDGQYGYSFIIFPRRECERNKFYHIHKFVESPFQQTSEIVSELSLSPQTLQLLFCSALYSDREMINKTHAIYGFWFPE